MKKAVLWDFGGVILASPFEAFNRYETERGIPLDFIRTVRRSPIWAQRPVGAELRPGETVRRFG